MSEFWSAWVMVLIAVNLGIILFLFIWSLRVRIPTQPDGTSGHVWAHGVLREAVRRLPVWWIVISAAAFVVAFGYLALFPGFGAFSGFLGWTSQGELERTQAANRRLEAPLHDRVRGNSIETIAADPGALRAGGAIFIENCAACHGRNAKGNRAIGAPDLTDNDWLYGGDEKAILTSILDGRRGTMPAFGGSIPAESILDLAHYVASLSDMPYDSLRAQIGRPLFSNCVPCHGAEGKGNQALGAPNLTDATRLHGAIAPRAVAEIISRGKDGVMPAWRGRLSDEDVALVAAWVYARSHPTTAAAR